MIGLLGDLHGRFEAISKAMSSFKADLWLQIGDLGGEYVDYVDLPNNFWFIQGNHENWKLLKGMKSAPDGPFLRNGAVYELPLSTVQKKIRVAAFGGNYSPKWYPQAREKVPESRDRHYVEAEKAALMASKDIDILLTHDAPSPFMRGSQDIGRPEIKELAEAVKPRLHVFGHHHFQCLEDRGGIKTLGLSYGWVNVSLWDETTGEVSVTEMST